MKGCPRCDAGLPHVQSRNGKPACTGHVMFEHRNTPSDEPKVRLAHPAPCNKGPMRGQTICDKHGGTAKQNKAAGGQRTAEAEVTATARKLIPDADERTPIANPLERLLELASEADAFRESLRHMANKLDAGDIRYRGTGAGAEQLRAEVTTYRQALKDTTDMLVAIAKLDIEKMLARIESRKVDLVLDAMNAGVNEAGLDDDQKRAVMAGVARHLRSVRRPAA